MLPTTVATKVDVSHLVSEVERVDEELTAGTVRAKAGSEGHSQPVLSTPLSDFLDQNKVTLDDAQDRTELIKQLRLLKNNVPTIHMTFAVTADNESIQKLVQWVRTSAHPQAVIAVGLQPALVAGVYLRTPNHIHDLSVRGLLEGQHSLLVKELETLRGSK